MFTNRNQPNRPILDEYWRIIFDERWHPITEENGQTYRNRSNVRTRVWYDSSFAYDAQIAYDKAYTNNNN